MRKLNKKAQLMDDWMDVVFVLLISLFIFGFYFTLTYSTEKAQEVRIKEDLDEIHYKAALTQYLNSQINENNTITDLISQSYLNQDYTELRKQTEDIFPKFNIISWSLILSEQDYAHIFSTHDKTYETALETTRVAEIIIPIQEKPLNYIRVQLFIGSGEIKYA